MKAKKIVAIVMGTALVGTVAVGMSACSGGNKKPDSLTTGTLNIADYAAEYESQYSVKGLTSVETVYSLKGSDVVDYLDSGYLVVKDGTDKVAVMNPYTGKKVLSGLSSDCEIENYETGYDVDVIWVTYTDAQENETVEIYTYDGTKILAKDAYDESSLDVAVGNYYVGNDTKMSNVFHVTIDKQPVGDADPVEVEVYVKVTVDDKTQEVTYSVVNKSDLKVYAPEYGAGSDLSGIYTDLSSAGEDKPVENALKDYKMSTINENKVTFIKNGTETGSVDLTNGEQLGIMGTSLYYTVGVPVSPDETKGYNFAAIGSKVDYSLYKYDIVENTTTELEYDIIVTGMSPVYNYATKSCDAAIISGMKISDDGVAYGADAFTYVINSNFELCYDVTGLLSSHSEPEIYNIGSDKYLVGSYSGGVVVDKDFNVQSKLSNATVYNNAGLVLVRDYYSGKYGFKDYSGKVVIAPEYSGVYGSIKFYGDAAYVQDADGEEVLLKKDGTVTKIADLEKSADATVTKQVQVKGAYYVLTTTTTPAEGDPTQTVAYYALDGKLLKSFTKTALNQIFDQVLPDGTVLVEETVIDATTHESITTAYKLV